MHMLFNQLQQKFSGSQVTNQWKRAVKSMSDSVYSFVPKEGSELFQSIVDNFTGYFHQMLQSCLTQHSSVEPREEEQPLAAAAAAAEEEEEREQEEQEQEEANQHGLAAAASAYAGPFASQTSSYFSSASPLAFVTFPQHERGFLPPEWQEDACNDVTGTASSLELQRPQKRPRDSTSFHP